jgi:hypothetical protein
MDIKIGDKFKCLKTINNIFRHPLFIKDNVYDVLSIDDEYITLNHVLYANEYSPFKLDFILINFEKL